MRAAGPKGAGVAGEGGLVQHKPCRGRWRGRNDAVEPTGEWAMALLGFEVLERRGFANGAEFGAAGAYEYLRCRAHYAVDPAAPAQAPITDLQHAPRGADGLVHFATVTRRSGLQSDVRRLSSCW